MPADPLDPDHGGVFAYGTLCHPAVQCALFGRRLPGIPDVLTGAVCDWIDDADPEVLRLTGQRGYPALRRVADPTRRVDGLWLPIRAADLDRADHYEGPGYRRECLRLASGRMAWVYVAAT